jgi:Zn-dependent protease with chaperone function
VSPTSGTPSLAAAAAAWAAFYGCATLLIEIARRRAMHRGAADPSRAWFPFALSIQWITIGTWVGGFWLAAGWRLGDALAATFGGRPFQSWTLAAVPAFSVSLWAQWRVSQVSRRLRGDETPAAEAIGRSLRPFLSLLILVATVSCVTAMAGRLPLFAPLSILLLGLSAALLILRRSAAHAAVTPHAITSGELRDRLVALGERAGVRVRQLYVMPQSTARVANAFAVQGNSVVLTDYLIRHLDRDEIDAVFAHELSHLKGRHPTWLAVCLLTLVAAVAMEHSLTGSPGLSLLVGAALLAGHFAAARAFEYEADAGAVRLGARPQALISGIARLGRLNHVPPRWSPWLELTLTHPSLERRARQLERRTGAAELAAGLDAVTEPGEPYPMPAALAPGGKVFSTELKRRIMARVARICLLGCPLAVVATLAALAWLGAPWPLQMALGVAASLGFSVAAAQRFGRLPHRAMRAELERRVAGRGLGPPAAGSWLVGIAPGSESRVIDGFYVWDVGLLRLGRSRIDYFGEETSFTLDPGRVAALSLTAGPPSWRRTRCVRLAWVDGEGVTRTMRLFALEPDGRGGLAAATRRLFEAIGDSRRAGAPGGLETAGPPFGAPRHHEVTSIAPREALRPVPLLVWVLVQCVVASLVALVAMLIAHDARMPGFIEVATCSALGYLATILPLVLHREPARIELAAQAERLAA